MKKQLGWFAALALLAAWAGHVNGAPIVQSTWETAGDEEGWSISGVVPTPGAGDDPSAYGTIDQGLLSGQNALIITGGASDPGVNEDYISADSGAGYPGNYTALNVGSIGFDFYDGEGLAAADDLRLYFYNDSTSVTWFYDINSSLGWNSYSASIADTSGAWYSADVGASWNTDLGAVSEVGLYIRYLASQDSQVYGVDNFELNENPVPEPETYAMLGFAMVGLCVTFRRRIEESLQGVVQNIRG